MTTHLPTNATDPLYSNDLPPLGTEDAPLAHIGVDEPTQGTLSIADTPFMDIVLLCGVGPVAHAVALLAAHAHFAVDIVEVEPDILTEDSFPMARQRFVLPSFANLAEVCGIGAQHYIAILTAHPQHSEDLLSQALHTPARYIGLSGSREQRAPLFALLRERGMPTTELACVRCPIGLPIGARNSQEKAIAIVAELIAAREGCLPRAPKVESA